jgi:cytochrome b6-f complex iron-sulfur subunit
VAVNPITRPKPVQPTESKSSSTSAPPQPKVQPKATPPTASASEQHSILTSAESAELHAPMTRREFLNYAFLASIGLFFVTLGGAMFLYALPRFSAGEFGGTFDLGEAKDIVPSTSAPPEANTKGQFWLVNLDAQTGHGKPGVLALYNVCPHLGCLYQWQPVTNRFECPCHGSRYQKDGTYISGPAPRSLDRMVIRFLDAKGNVLAQTDATGDPLPVPDPNAEMVVDTGNIILGKTHG